MDENLYHIFKRNLSDDKDLKKIPATWYFASQNVYSNEEIYKRIGFSSYYKDSKYYLNKFYKPISQLKF